MKKYEVIISDHADEDLREIYEYIAFELCSPGNAIGQLERIEKAICKLETSPEKHRIYEEEPWRDYNLRVLPVDNYCIFYIPDNDTLKVTVIRVIYEGRDIKTQLNVFTNEVIRPENNPGDQG